jgi:hypothetical protein
MLLSDRIAYLVLGLGSFIVINLILLAWRKDIAGFVGDVLGRNKDADGFKASSAGLLLLALFMEVATAFFAFAGIKAFLS